MSQSDPKTIRQKEKALRAAEELTAEGKEVTVRAVQQRAGVANWIAAEGAREWNTLRAEEERVPECPDDVTIRFEGIWRASYVAARSEFDDLKAVLTKRLEDAEAKIVGLEAETDDLTQKLAQAETEAKDAGDRALRIEGKLEAVTAEREQFLGERDQALSERDQALAERDRLRSEIESMRGR